jgi:hypothetical protein
MRLFVILIALIAVVVGVLALTLPREEIVKLIIFRDFFDVSLPILAFGALIKYLCTCTRDRHSHCDKSADKTCSK